MGAKGILCFHICCDRKILLGNAAEETGWPVIFV
jgi:hypothetical protein